MQTRVETKPNTRKRMLIMIGAVLALIAVIAGIKVLLVMKMLSVMQDEQPITSVSATTTAATPWPRASSPIV